MTKTWGDLAKEFIACETKDQAEKWLKAEIARSVEQYKHTPKEAESILRSSLGYMMGYYDDDTAMKMQRLLDLTHPLLPWVGKEPTTLDRLDDAFEIGKSFGATHGFDLSPLMEYRMTSVLGRPSLFMNSFQMYRDVEYVKKEVKDLAEQLARLSSKLK